MDEIRDILPILKQFGVSPEQLGPERLRKLITFSSKIKDPSKITQESSRQLMNILGIGAPIRSKTRSAKDKVGRNDRCPCESGNKWKKCCMPH